MCSQACDFDHWVVSQTDHTCQDVCEQSLTLYKHITHILIPYSDVGSRLSTKYGEMHTLDYLFLSEYVYAPLMPSFTFFVSKTHTRGHYCIWLIWSILTLVVMSDRPTDRPCLLWFLSKWCNFDIKNTRCTCQNSTTYQAWSVNRVVKAIYVGSHQLAGSILGKGYLCIWSTETKAKPVGHGVPVECRRVIK